MKMPALFSSLMLCSALCILPLKVFAAPTFIATVPSFTVGPGTPYYVNATTPSVSVPINSTHHIFFDPQMQVLTLCKYSWSIYLKWDAGTGTGGWGNLGFDSGGGNLPFGMGDTFTEDQTYTTNQTVGQGHYNAEAGSQLTGTSPAGGAGQILLGSFDVYNIPSFP